jgi:hypothetical protein
MEIFIGNFDEWQEVLDVLDQGGMTDPKRYPTVYFAHQMAKKTNNFNMLENILTKFPWILTQAKNNARSCPFMPFPTSEEVKEIQGTLNLGIVNDNGNNAGMYPLDSTRGIFICGEPGSGKTYEFLRLFDQILSIPKDERGFNIIVIQVLKRDVDFLIKRHPGLRIIEWQNLRWNMFEAEPWEIVDKSIDLACSVFSSTNYLMSMTQPILRLAVKICVEKNKVREGSGNYPTFSQIVSEIDNAATQMNLTGYEKKNTCDRLKIRLLEFKETGETLNSRCGYKIDDFWSKEDICLNVMDISNDYIYSTMITDLLIKLQNYYESDVQNSGRLRTLVCIDECRSVFPVKSDQYDYSADRFLERWVTTSRACGIGRITITQEPKSVATWLSNNCAYFMTFPISGEGVDHLKKLQNLSDEQSAYIDKLPKYGTCIFRDRRFDRCYLVKVPGDLNVETISRLEVENIMKPYIERLQDQLPKPEQKEDAAGEKTGNRDIGDYLALKREAGAKYNAIKMLEILRSDPFIHYTAMRNERLKLSDSDIKLAIGWLNSNGLITRIKCVGPRGKEANYMVMTDAAYDFLGVSAVKRISPSHFKHTLYCERVKSWLESKGHTAMREYGTLSGGRVANESGRIDVYASDTNIAYEITLTHNRRDIMSNVNKCLYLFRVDKLVIVCEWEKNIHENVKPIILADVPENHLKMIEYASIQKFL